MRTLLLIRHSLPAIVPGTPAAAWRLSAAGRRRCAPLAHALAHYQPAVAVSSMEPKARETAELVAAALSLPVEMADGLHEHARRTVGYFGSRTEFEARVAEFFARPDALVLGEETATQARDRFERAVAGVVAAHPAGNVAIVTHGTVLTLFAAAHAAVEPLAFWRRLGLPCCVAFSLPGYHLSAVTAEIAEE